MSEKTWPETLCGDPVTRPHLGSPLRIDGEIVCTDGKLMVVIPDDGRDATDPDDRMGDTIRGMLSADSDTAASFEIEALCSWCGPYETECPDCDGKPCATCDDTGAIDCECMCGDEHDRDCPDCRGCVTCDGEGFADRYAIDRRATLFGVPFSKRLLAALLDGAPGDTVEIGKPFKAHDPFILTGDGWRGLLMPMRIDDDFDHDPLDSLALEAAS